MAKTNKPKVVNAEPEPKVRSMFSLKLTKYELVHLRDLFSVTLPPGLKETLSQRLALSQERTSVETKLWQKIVTQCQNAELPLGDDAPDFVLSATETPPLTVYEVASEPQDDSQEENE